MINLKNFPTYTKENYNRLMRRLTPIEEMDSYYYKRDDYFSLGGLLGGKVRQCLSLVYHELHDTQITGLVTSAGLPSPQSCIVSGVAKYFDLPSAVAVFKYNNKIEDVNRINVSLAQRLGAVIYGVNNPRKSSVDKAGKELSRYLGYYYVDFGMAGKFVMDMVADQCENLPGHIENVVIIGGSGFSALGVALGIRKFNKRADTIYVVYLSRYFGQNKRKWYDTLPNRIKFEGTLVEIESPIPYQVLYNPDGDFRFDLTYESKAHQWMIDNMKPDGKTLFWVVGKREYDMSYIEPIKWHELPPKRGMLF